MNGWTGTGWRRGWLALGVSVVIGGQAWAQPLEGFQPPGGPGGFPPFGPGGPSGFGGPGGPGGFGPPGFGGAERKVLKEYDKDKNGWLNLEERKAARENLGTQGGGRRGPGGPRGMGRGEPGKPGPKVAQSEVKTYPASVGLYETTALRTLFLEFENADWEKELEVFHGTDVDVPCTLTVDGKKYPLVGARFRGMSSYGMVPTGSKRSFNLSMDLADDKQRLLGYKTLNLLNAHEDPTFMGSVLYSQIARRHIPAPRANLVKVVVNGESWGIYANVQQFNKEFMTEHFKSAKGARWKVSGSPGGRGGLEYTGDNVEDYKRRFEIKSADKKESWEALINLCRVLNETPTDRLKGELEKILDIDGLLWFLALDIGLINGDGYWIRSSDYSIALDEKGKFHILPHDMNEAFHAPHGPGMGGPGRRGGRGGPGGPGGFPAPPKPGDIMPVFLREMLELTDEQRAKMDALQKETDAKLEALFTPEQRKQLEEMQKNGPMGFGFPGGPGGPGGNRADMGSGLEINPLAGLSDPSKPLRSKVLAVPELKQAYLAKVRQLAEEDLDWTKMAPTVKALRELVDAEIKADTRKLSSYEEFLSSTEDAPGEGESLRHFFEVRRKFLLKHPEVSKAK